MDVPTTMLEAAGFELRFVALSGSGRTLAFPCDADGHVDLDTLSPRAVGDYLYARAMVGREFRPAAVAAKERAAR